MTNRSLVMVGGRGYAGGESQVEDALRVRMQLQWNVRQPALVRDAGDAAQVAAQVKGGWTGPSLGRILGPTSEGAGRCPRPADPSPTA